MEQTQFSDQFNSNIFFVQGTDGDILIESVHVKEMNTVQSEYVYSHEDANTLVDEATREMSPMTGRYSNLFDRLDS